MHTEFEFHRLRVMFMFSFFDQGYLHLSYVQCCRITQQLPVGIDAFRLRCMSLTLLDLSIDLSGSGALPVVRFAAFSFPS
jgi:hypothetical protein